MKYYVFSDETGNGGSKIFFNYIFLPFFPLFIFLFLKVLLSKYVNLEFITPTVNKIIGIIMILFGIVWAYKYHSAPKGVFTYDDYLQIETHFFLRHYVFPFNPKIEYQDIKSISLENKKSQSYKEFNEKHLYFISGYRSETKKYVKIETVDRIYCFCVDNQEKFVEEVSKRMEKIR